MRTLGDDDCDYDDVGVDDNNSVLSILGGKLADGGYSTELAEGTVAISAEDSTYSLSLLLKLCFTAQYYNYMISFIVFGISLVIFQNPNLREIQYNNVQLR